MARRIIIVSSIVDSTIRETQRDANIKIFLSLEDLGNYVSRSPLRADTLFFTKDVIPNTTTSLSYLLSLLENPFLKVDNITYITSIGSEEIPTVDFIVKDKNLTNWEVVQIPISRENISGIIDGTLREDKVGTKKRVVFRQPRETYIREQMHRKESLKDSYEDDETYLSDIPDESMPIITPEEIEEDAKVLHIVGKDSHERTAFTLLCAQYLSLSGKVLILEKDVDYHLLTEMVTKLDIRCFKVEVSDFMKDPVKVVDDIRHAKEKLIVVTSIKRVQYNYNYVFSVLYNNLSDKIRVFVKESTYEEVPSTDRFILVFPNTIPSVLETCESIDPAVIDNCKFLSVNMYYSPNIRVNDKNVLSSVVSDILGKDLEVDILNITTLNLNEGDYDMRGVLS